VIDERSESVHVTAFEIELTVRLLDAVADRTVASHCISESY
jgi:hypothetical protein